MKIEFDNAKNERNIKLRGLSFELAAKFDFDGAIEVEQVVSGEQRYFALGHIGPRLYALVYTLRTDFVRVISLRKANKREVRRYEQFN
ncbi:BrnT family toxin [Marinobacter sp. S6332]|uniref:BrnT family toxin n=1 Tax=Marinobacter sp. S6332 TaxID=2926403 RepID=UPI001FF242EC|nr:BrnT family toxin [Marinobacter sp. S6332]MCK0164335.1 BrnT family toxin [Marinobacter sp. S6332]